mmetsp:Transcript_88753/g.246541  ORF Transcript_88753/g.246541 Transcript_88753/m.246541 type:complete len:297 (-) Transcript_88753:1350-2240(-)
MHVAPEVEDAQGQSIDEGQPHRDPAKGLHNRQDVPTEVFLHGAHQVKLLEAIIRPDQKHHARLDAEQAAQKHRLHPARQHLPGRLAPEGAVHSVCPTVHLFELLVLWPGPRQLLVVLLEDVLHMVEGDDAEDELQAAGDHQRDLGHAMGAQAVHCLVALHQEQGAGQHAREDALEQHRGDADKDGPRREAHDAAQHRYWPVGAANHEGHLGHRDSGLPQDLLDRPHVRRVDAHRAPHPRVPGEGLADELLGKSSEAKLHGVGNEGRPEEALGEGPALLAGTGANHDAHDGVNRRPR